MGSPNLLFMKGFYNKGKKINKKTVPVSGTVKIKSESLQDEF
jgi:hypothetical protein